MGRHWREFSVERPLTPADYAQPYAWWGWHWSPPVPLSIVEIIDAGTLHPRIAALLWLLLGARRSIVLASEPPMSGKTTLLSALVSFLSADTQPVFLRGLSETFDYTRNVDPAKGYLLVNELSSHLPVYLWGPKATRMFRTLRDGYGLGTTMHADGVAEAMDQLRNELDLGDADLGRIDVIGIMRTFAGDAAITGHDDVPPELRYGRDAIRRRLVALHLVSRANGAIDTPALSTWDHTTDEHALALDPHLDDLARRTARSVTDLCDALLQREAFLVQLAARGVRRVAPVRDAIAAYRGA
jgi:hypothetical protein